MRNWAQINGGTQMYLNCNERLEKLARAHTPANRTAPKNWELKWATRDQGTGTVWLCPWLSKPKYSTPEWNEAQATTNLTPIDTGVRYIILPIPSWVSVSSEDYYAGVIALAVPAEDALAMVRDYILRLQEQMRREFPPRPCTCGSGRGWETCGSGSPYCG